MDTDKTKIDENYDTSEKGNYGVEKEWADRLGIDFDPAKIPEPPRQDVQPEPPQFRPEPPKPPVQDPAWLPPMHPNGPMPPTYMVWSIIATILCCLPAGIVAIVYSSSVSSRYYARDYEGARRASERAEIWIIVSIVTGIIFNALYLPLSLLLPQ